MSVLLNDIYYSVTLCRLITIKRHILLGHTMSVLLNDIYYSVTLCHHHHHHQISLIKKLSCATQLQGCGYD